LAVAVEQVHVRVEADTQVAGAYRVHLACPRIEAHPVGVGRRANTVVLYAAYQEELGSLGNAIRLVSVSTRRRGRRRRVRVNRGSDGKGPRWRELAARREAQGVLVTEPTRAALVAYTQEVR